MNQGKSSDVYINYSTDDTTYGGAKQIVLKELQDIQDRRGTSPDNIKALALSGGGIRSASFCLGVLQGLVKKNKLDDFDYLSTVSGGGYLGGALSWAWLNNWKKNADCDDTFGRDPDNFPYGTGNRYANTDENMDRKQSAMMRHLRQNGHYLTPGKGITTLSFLSVIFRSIIMGLFTLLVLVSLGYHLLHALTPVFNTGYFTGSYALDGSLFLLLAYFLTLLLYGLFAIQYRSNPRASYDWRRRWEIYIKYILLASITILIVALSEEVRTHLGIWIEEAGGTSALIGALLAWKTQTASENKVLSYTRKKLLVYLFISSLFFGLFVLANHIACLIHETKSVGLYIHGGVAAVVLISAFLIPINRVSIHRYYRDRLMEVFMPDICRLFNPQGRKENKASYANEAYLHECMPEKDNRMPYHLINTNIILVESEIQKFRGRCGDNFLLSPLYCGSNATGWSKTASFAGGSITLPTAVAISGAAANSDSGVAGAGLSVNPLVSAIMSIFNLRLGYWTVNPDPEKQPKQSVTPNYIEPGFRGVIKTGGLNENANFIQLSDGGHFENLALYELIRRRCKFIVCCDAEQDSDFVFASLSNIIEKARVDFGTHISIGAEQLESLRYTRDDNGQTQFAESGFIIADIEYPNEEQLGTLIYIKSTLPADLPADVMGYYKTHPAFPHETTADQFFDEKQMEAYRMLGMNIAERMLDSLGERIYSANPAAM